ncbi:hypothetical protein ACH5WX_09035, partial [Nocardioides sp. CER28]
MERRCWVEAASVAPWVRRSKSARCDARSESAWEPLLRILHVACDVPALPQATLRDAADVVVAIAGTPTLQEYDGGDPLERTTHRQDRRRDSRLERPDTPATTAASSIEAPARTADHN